MCKNLYMEVNFIISTKEVSDALNYYINNYEMSLLPCKNKIEYIQTKNEFVCRFCGKDKSETTFKKKAHAIPELIGNKTLLTKNECDICNDKFGRLLEDNLSKFLLPYNSISKICGKNGVPTYKDQNIRIETIDGKTHITYSKTENIKIDENNKTFFIQMHTQKLKPIKVYKAFLKMGLSLIPESELTYFKDLLSYVIEEEDRVSKGLSKVIEIFTPGIQPYKQITNILLKRKNDDIQAPYMFYILSYGNFLFQTMLPSLIKDDKFFKAKQQFNIPAFPSCHEFILNQTTGNIVNSRVRVIDLFQKEPTVFPVGINFQYEKIKKRDIDESKS